MEFKTFAELVRLPAVLSVPGDTLLGSSVSGRIQPLRAIGLATSSSMLYLGGMALNDYADRDIDANERPRRPIPSGRVSPKSALRIAQALTVGGVLLAGIAGGKRSLAIASLLAADVWAYDMTLKSTRFGPASMASCRSLNVLLGSTSGNTRAALKPAIITGAHILAVTNVSTFEVQGGSGTVGEKAFRRTLSVASSTFAFGAQRSFGKSKLAAAVGLAGLGAYAAPMLSKSLSAADDPSPRNLQQLVGTGVIGTIPLQSALIASSGRTATAAGVCGLWPITRYFSKKRSVT